ncbi:winged helix-turn-helix transcriptional regulator [Saccharospirillum salsuginis]|uniref:HxlR family transcriptional regulator n=1 Tax=Saccharospirillum salsuginis TaxID=418750 RepID=A0A918NB75_9GAMM|nr:helix-turn-helix domain-containing protein [Saccharospirillum salsuginis]GGX57682.1 HxlR family transcriptional regulator [Saccharospirillum salsuginis]
MKSYGQFCPVAKAAEVFCERWTPLILRELACGATRFAELQRGIPLASPTILARRLKQLEAEGVIERHRSTSGRSWTYHLTRAGEEFAPIVEALGVWGQRWTRRRLTEQEMDLGLLLWELESTVKPEAFGDGLTVVELEVCDQPEHKRWFWFRNIDGHCELCLKKPDDEIDLYFSSTLSDLIYLWRGDIAIVKAIDTGRLRVHGNVKPSRAVAQWFGLCPLAHIQPQQSQMV